MGLRAWINIGLILALVAAAWWIDRRGYAMGFSAAETAHRAATLKAQAEVAKAAEAASRREAARLAAQAQADTLARELENAAMHDPGAGLCGIGLDGVRRLARR